MQNIARPADPRDSRLPSTKVLLINGRKKAKPCCAPYTPHVHLVYASRFSADGINQRAADGDSVRALERGRPRSLTITEERRSSVAVAGRLPGVGGARWFSRPERGCAEPVPTPVTPPPFITRAAACPSMPPSGAPSVAAAPHAACTMRAPNTRAARR